ncbi:hypothetical protein [Acetobacter sp. P1H12_c]|uniref:hypothetical protein n=1 Tax=Acetobacter sp. P1H12_c TaxID=2762621 RepID=UPI001C05743B|nr:hypothetical protein [Acetobacter sp. P1H12_c]
MNKNLYLKKSMHVPLQSNLLMENLDDRKACQFLRQKTDEILGILLHIPRKTKNFRAIFCLDEEVYKYL